MGREVRKVPFDWEHPKCDHDRFIPLYNRDILDYHDEDGEPIYEFELMPDFGDKATHYMMYEDTTEGTPLSPAFASPSELAMWLVNNGVSAFGTRTASYSEWMHTIEQGSAPSMVFSPGIGFVSGVEARL